MGQIRLLTILLTTTFLPACTGLVQLKDRSADSGVAIASSMISSASKIVVKDEQIVLVGMCLGTVTRVEVLGTQSASDIKITAPCVSRQFSLPLTPPVVDGEFSLELRGYADDVAAGPALILNFVRDTTPPSGLSIALDGGAMSTPHTSVSVAVSVSDAEELYLTNSVGCATGGVWEPIVATRTGWTVGQLNGLATVYAKTRDLAKNESACTSASIVQDSIAPTITFTTPAVGAKAYLSARSSFATGGACSESGRDVNIVIGGSAAVAPCVAGAWAYSADLTMLPASSFQVLVNQADASGNSSLDVERSFDFANQDLSVQQWDSLLTHGASGEIALPIAADGSYVEDRCGVLKIRATFSEPIDPDSFTSSSIQLAGTSGTNAAVDVSAITVSRSLGNSDTEAFITFSSFLPDLARYRMKLRGIHTVDGDEFVGGQQEIKFTALKGDADGNLFVDSNSGGTPDGDFVRTRSGQTVDLSTARADLNCNGALNVTDINLGKSLNGRDLRAILYPAPF